MIFSVEINDKIYKIDLSRPLDISIPLSFGGAQPNAFGVERATATAYETENLIGDVRRGGSCNFEQIKFIPHCNGTHTEGVGHITRARISVHELLRDSFIPATLVSVAAENAFQTKENYSVELNDSDAMITRRTLEKALENTNEDFMRGLIVRTLPNDAGKLTRRYMENAPPFFSTEAMRFVVEKNVEHLLVDAPSIDRTFDEGKLSNHRVFWNVEEGAFETDETSFINNTITEMIYVPDEIADGAYFLNLQIAPFASDAAPSRPRLFKFSE